jgi:hypothetical protein
LAVERQPRGGRMQRHDWPAGQSFVCESCFELLEPSWFFLGRQWWNVFWIFCYGDN